ncbi:MAG: hypothetical protein MUC38_01595 [Cyclobacteriaceae bacterium]|jgi:hypothetical protein|nr:hypothetical protein [Cyclobacteriaceae bacterium]
MKTKTKKTFDAVAFMRMRREEIAAAIDGMTPRQEMAYFRKKAAEFNRKLK